MLDTKICVVSQRQMDNSFKVVGIAPSGPKVASILRIGSENLVNGMPMFRVEEFPELGTDSCLKIVSNFKKKEIKRFINHYKCSVCETEWTDEWDFVCNRNCPKCNKEIEPYKHEEIE